MDSKALIQKLSYFMFHYISSINGKDGGYLNHWNKFRMEVTVLTRDGRAKLKAPFSLPH